MVAFLKGIPQDVLAKASLRSKAYTRALMHFEAYILENKENIQDHLTFLQVRQQVCDLINNTYCLIVSRLCILYISYFVFNIGSS